MDSSIEARLNKFSSAVMEEAQKELERYEAEIKEKKSETIDKRYDELLNDAYDTIQEFISGVQKTDNDKVRLFEFEAKKELLKKRENIIEEVFCAAKDKVLEFKKSDQYPIWLRNKLKSAKEDTGTGKKEIFILDEDKELITPDEDSEIIVTQDKEFLGGVIVKNIEKGILSDYSFKELLYSQKSDFLQKSGLVI